MRLFKKTLTSHWLFNVWIDERGQICPEGTLGARCVESRRVPAGTPGSVKRKEESAKWYARLPGNSVAVPLHEDSEANRKLAEMLLAINDLQAHRKRP